jgi:Concanavalin A-like lectin/glucanases superfamily
VGNEPAYQALFTRTNSFGLSEWMHSGTTDSMWFNGQNVATYTGALQSINGVGNIAFLGQGSNNTFYPGDVSEVIVYKRALSTSERQAVEQYLMNKYHL